MIGLKRPPPDSDSDSNNGKRRAASHQAPGGGVFVCCLLMCLLSGVCARVCGRCSDGWMYNVYGVHTHVFTCTWSRYARSQPLLGTAPQHSSLRGV